MPTETRPCTRSRHDHTVTKNDEDADKLGDQRELPDLESFWGGGPEKPLSCTRKRFPGAILVETPRRQLAVMGDGILYMVATPIGNLEDITVRALSVLRSVDLIACEDTRKSRILLSHWGISTEVMSLHKFSEVRRTETVLQRMMQGQKVAVISDAGTPALSDPGNRLVRAALNAGFTVSPIPGASSISAALSVCGMDVSSFVYLGFAPRKDREKREFFKDIFEERRCTVFFETPRRIEATLTLAAEILGSRGIVLLRELTKIHEQILTGKAEEILQALTSRNAVRGEMVVVVEGATDKETSVDLVAAVKTLVREGLSGKHLAEEAQLRFGVRKGDAYQAFLNVKGEEDL